MSKSPIGFFLLASVDFDTTPASEVIVRTYPLPPACTDGSWAGTLAVFSADYLPILLYILLFLFALLGTWLVIGDSRRHVPWRQESVYIAMAIVYACVAFVWFVSILIWKAWCSPTPYPQFGCGLECGFPVIGSAILCAVVALALLLIFDLKVYVRWPITLMAVFLFLILFNFWGLISILRNNGWQVLLSDVFGGLSGVIFYFTAIKYFIGDERHRLHKRAIAIVNRTINDNKNLA